LSLNDNHANKKKTTNKKLIEFSMQIKFLNWTKFTQIITLFYFCFLLVFSYFLLAHKSQPMFLKRGCWWLYKCGLPHWKSTRKLLGNTCVVENVCFPNINLYHIQCIKCTWCEKHYYNTFLCNIVFQLIIQLIWTIKLSFLWYWTRD
jgi:hypothetical protein